MEFILELSNAQETFLNWRLRGGLFTWPNQDDQMNMTKISEHDQKIDNDER